MPTPSITVVFTAHDAQELAARSAEYEAERGEEVDR